MAYKITLKDTINTDGWTSPTPDPPVKETSIEYVTTVTTLDLNVYVDLLAKKREWTISWGYMKGEDYTELKAFYDRQFSLLKFPTVSIPDLGVANVVVRATLSEKNVADQSGLIENVELTLRETVQKTETYKP